MIEVKDLIFSYQKQKETLHGLTFSVAAGHQYHSIPENIYSTSFFIWYLMRIIYENDVKSECGRCEVPVK